MDHSSYSDDTLQELVGQSLRDIIEERNRTLNKPELQGIRIKPFTTTGWHYPTGRIMKCMLHRIVYISLLDGSTLDEISAYYEKVLKDIQNQNECITGLLLMYKKCCIHVIESSTESIADFCYELKTNTNYMIKTKILTISHDIPSRLYQHWSFRLLDISLAGLDEYGVGEDWAAHVTEILERMLKLGLFLSHQPKVQPKNTMDTLREKVPELLPDQGAIIHLLEGEDNCIEDLEIFEERHSLPYDILLARGYL